LGVAWATWSHPSDRGQRGLGAYDPERCNNFLLDVIYLGIICIGCLAC